METIRYTIRRNRNNGFYIRKEVLLSEKDCLLFADSVWSHGDNIFTERASLYFKYLAEYCREHNSDCWDMLQLATVKSFDELAKLPFVNIEIPAFADCDEIFLYSQENVDVIRFNQ